MACEDAARAAVTADQLQTALRVLSADGSDEEWAVVGLVLRLYLECAPAARETARRWALEQLRESYEPGPVLETPRGACA